MTGQPIRTIAANPTEAGRTVYGATETVVIVGTAMVIAIIAELLALTRSAFYRPQGTTWIQDCSVWYHDSGGLAEYVRRG